MGYTRPGKKHRNLSDEHLTVDLTFMNLLRLAQPNLSYFYHAQVNLREVELHLITRKHPIQWLYSYSPAKKNFNDRST